MSFEEIQAIAHGYLIKDIIILVVVVGVAQILYELDILEER